jgi:peptidyl-tRNA hydrolase, PTH1 family
VVAEAAIRLVVGLGNPGEKYARTRHNAGFWFVDELARRHGGQFRAEPKHQGELARVRVNGPAGTSAELWLFKPTTYMNKSGGAIASLSHFYKLPIAATLVAHDELDLPPGVARLKWAIGHPGHKDQVLDYVLQRASAADEQCINEAILKSADLLPVLLFEGAEKAMNRLHTQDQ